MSDFFDNFHVQQIKPDVEDKIKDDTGISEENPVDIEAKEETSKVKTEEEATSKKDSENTESSKEDENKSEEKSEEEILKLKEEHLSSIEAKSEDERSEEEKEFYSKYKEDKSGEDEDNFSLILKSLQDDTILSLEEDKEYKGEEGFKEAITFNIKKGIDTYKETFDTETKKYLDFLEAGGKREDYWENLHEEKYAEVDENNPVNHKFLVEDLYRNQGYSSEDIREKIEMLEENGKLEKEAKIAKASLTKLQQDRDNKILAEQQTKAAENEALRERSFTEFESKVKELEDIQGYKVTPKEKEDLIKYMSKPVKDGKTQYQIDASNLDTQITQAFLLKKNFKLENLEKKISSKVTKDLKDSINKLSTKKFKNTKPAETSKPKGDQPIKITWNM